MHVYEMRMFMGEVHLSPKSVAKKTPVGFNGSRLPFLPELYLGDDNDVKKIRQAAPAELFLSLDFAQGTLLNWVPNRGSV